MCEFHIILISDLPNPLDLTQKIYKVGGYFCLPCIPRTITHGSQIVQLEQLNKKQNVLKKKPILTI